LLHLNRGPVANRSSEGNVGNEEASSGYSSAASSLKLKFIPTADKATGKRLEWAGTRHSKLQNARPKAGIALHLATIGAMTLLAPLPYLSLCCALRTQGVEPMFQETEVIEGILDTSLRH
jgi:hypothetical protein